MMTPTTARKYISTSSLVLRRARSWFSKKLAMTALFSQQAGIQGGHCRRHRTVERAGHRAQQFVLHQPDLLVGGDRRAKTGQHALLFRRRKPRKADEGLRYLAQLQLVSGL